MSSGTMTVKQYNGKKFGGEFTFLLEPLNENNRENFFI